jgi:hypothetical protein
MNVTVLRETEKIRSKKNGASFILTYKYSVNNYIDRIVCVVGYKCMCCLDYWVRVCYHDREQHLRRDDHRPQGIAAKEGFARYGHQGGGQRQAGQIQVI